jgi:hypothetical protein
MFPFILGILFLLSGCMTWTAQGSENVRIAPVKGGSPAVTVPVVDVKKAPLADEFEIVPASLPKGWQTCGRFRLNIAYINALPIWQRFFLSPYRSLQAMRYKRCAKALMPSTQAFMEATYPLPYVPVDPQTSLKSKSPKPLNTTP